MPIPGRALGALLLSYAMAGCLPTVIHGPRIESGTRLGATVGGTSGPTYTDGDEGGIHFRSAVFGAYLAQGWAPRTPNLPGIDLAVIVPVPFVPFAQANLFVQAPPAWTGHMSAGAGANLSIDSEAYYAQLGRINDAGRGWFLTQGVSLRRSGRDYTTSIASVTGATVQFTQGMTREYVFAQFASGRTSTYCYINAAMHIPCAKGDYLWALSLGITLERRFDKRSAKPPR